MHCASETNVYWSTYCCSYLGFQEIHHLSSILRVTPTFRLMTDCQGRFGALSGVTCTRLL